MASRTPTPPPALEPAAGETPRQAAARAELERLRAEEDFSTQPATVTAAGAARAGYLRERDHREGCPVTVRPDGANRVETYAERVTAPSRTLIDLGVRAGDHVVIVRCQECAAMRYATGYTGADAADVLKAFTRARLELELAGAAPTTRAELDGVL